jgi:hypothetical protein
MNGGLPRIPSYAPRGREQAGRVHGQKGLAGKLGHYRIIGGPDCSPQRGQKESPKRPALTRYRASS